MTPFFHHHVPQHNNRTTEAEPKLSNVPVCPPRLHETHWSLLFGKRKSDTSLETRHAKSSNTSRAPAWTNGRSVCQEPGACLRLLWVRQAGSSPCQQESGGDITVLAGPFSSTSFFYFQEVWGGGGEQSCAVQPHRTMQSNDAQIHLIHSPPSMRCGHPVPQPGCWAGGEIHPGEGTMGGREAAGSLQAWLGQKMKAGKDSTQQGLLRRSQSNSRIRRRPCNYGGVPAAPLPAAAPCTPHVALPAPPHRPARGAPAPAARARPQPRCRRPPPASQRRLGREPWQRGLRSPGRRGVTWRQGVRPGRGRSAPPCRSAGSARPGPGPTAAAGSGLGSQQAAAPAAGPAAPPAPWPSRRGAPPPPRPRCRATRRRSRPRPRCRRRREPRRRRRRLQRTSPAPRCLPRTQAPPLLLLLLPPSPRPPAHGAAAAPGAAYPPGPGCGDRPGTTPLLASPPAAAAVAVLEGPRAAAALLSA